MCTHCDHEAYARDRTLAIQLDDGSLLHLGHPLESDHVEAAGFTWPQAENQARLIRTTTRLCHACGRFARRHKRASPEGCLGILILLVALALTCFAVLPLYAYAIGHVTRSEMIFTLTLLALAALLAFTLWSLIRYREIHAFRAQRKLRPPLPDMPCCAAPRLRRLPFRRRNLPCPTCGHRTLTVRYSGKS
jgi:hypothetical protein